MSDVSTRIDDLTDDQRRLLLQQALREGAPRQAVAESERRSLCAFVVPSSDITVEAAALRQWLADRLPEHLVPSGIEFIPELPRLPNGKVDRVSLSQREITPRPETSPAQPLTDHEIILAKIWGDLLGVSRVDPADNFFELGGDSIVSIRMVSRAREQGLQIEVAQIADHPTVRALARCATSTATPARSSETTPARSSETFVGELPLSPIQHWFFGLELEQPQHWNQAGLFLTPEELDLDALTQAAQCCVDRHEALRCRFVRSDEGWRASVVAPAEAQVEVETVMLTGQETSEVVPADVLRSCQENFDLEQAPLLRLVLFRGLSQPQLLIVCHHLTVDLVSWSLLISQIEETYSQLVSQSSLPPVSPTTSYPEWVQRLSAWANGSEVGRQLDLWLSENSVDSLTLPHHRENLQRDDEASAEEVRIHLNETETSALLSEVHTAYNTKVQDLLVAALSMAMKEWVGCGSLRVGFEGHGREPFAEGVDVSQTVGWLTSFYPLTLQLGDCEGLPETIKSTKEQLRRVSHGGLGLGALSYLCDDRDVVERLNSISPPEVLFNYAGISNLAASQLLQPIGGAEETSRSGINRRSHALEINAVIEGGRLSATFRFGPSVLDRREIETLAKTFAASLLQLIEHCQSPHTGGATPSDFADSGLDQQQLDDLLAELD